VTVSDAVAILADQGGVESTEAERLLEAVRLRCGRSTEELSILVVSGNLDYADIH